MVDLKVGGTDRKLEHYVLFVVVAVKCLERLSLLVQMTLLDSLERKAESPNSEECLINRDSDFQGNIYILLSSLNRDPYKGNCKYAPIAEKIIRRMSQSHMARACFRFLQSPSTKNVSLTDIFFSLLEEVLGFNTLV